MRLRKHSTADQLPHNPQAVDCIEPFGNIEKFAMAMKMATKEWTDSDEMSGVADSPRTYVRTYVRTYLPPFNKLSSQHRVSFRQQRVTSDA